VRGRVIRLILSLVSVSASTGAFGYQIPEGCAAPPSAYAREFYVDPQNGSMTNDGSAAYPWSTLEAVTNAGLIATQAYPKPYKAGDSLLPSANARAVVHPGDVIYLRSGDHGVVSFKGAFNTGFITIKAAPRAKPILKQLTMAGGAYWIFDGLTIESLNTTGVYATATSRAPDYRLVTLRADGSNGPLENIIFHGNILKSAEDVRSWTQQDWLTKRASGILLNGGYVAGDREEAHVGGCYAVTDNKLQNIGFGVVATNASRVLISGNSIDYFTDDGIDYGASNMVIAHNVITNSLNDGSGFHRDAMQGQPYWGEDTVNHDVTFADNIVINQTDPRLPFPGCLQGIDTFDGVWRNLKAYNNVVITNVYHGMAFYGVTDLEIVNNTVLTDALPRTCHGVAGNTQDGGANTNFVASTKEVLSWITVQKAKSGRPSANVVVRNNIASAFNLNTPSATSDHNLIANAGLARDAFPADSLPAPHVNPKYLFVAFEPLAYRYDLHLKKGSPAIGAGSPNLAPSEDVEGVRRVTPIDLGAYARKAP